MNLGRMHLQPKKKCVPKEKTCAKCGETKSLDEFHLHNTAKYGRNSRCKTCISAYHKEHYAKNFEKIQEWRRAYDALPSTIAWHKEYRHSEAGKIATMEATRRRREKSRQRYIANNAVNNAIRDGRLFPFPCWACGATDHIEAHHPAYSLPLDVIWLCKKHHLETHVMARKSDRSVRS
jgi:hypothetical protein